MIESLLASPLVELFALAGATLLARMLFFYPSEPPTAAGAAIMGAGIFGLGALQHIPALQQLARPYAMEMLVIWAYVAAGFVSCAAHGRLRLHFKDPVGGFAVGTWVAGTVVVGRLVVGYVPEWRWLAVAMWALAFAIWLAYMGLVVTRLGVIVAAFDRLRVTGRILLATVSTQSLVILGSFLLGGLWPVWLSRAMIALGIALYAFGFALIVQRYLRQKGWRLSSDWDNTNCILHGAMSITGLAATVSHALPIEWEEGIWLWAAGMFVVVEVLELARLWQRVDIYGLRNGVLSYNVSQWARNFTFGMFYAFTLALRPSGQPGPAAGAGGADVPWAFAQDAVVAWGQYVVLVLLVAEVGLFVAQNVALRRVKAQAEKAAA